MHHDFTLTDSEDRRQRRNRELNRTVRLARAAERAEDAAHLIRETSPELSQELRDKAVELYAAAVTSLLRADDIKTITTI